jgi:hypothetical protein
LCEILISYFLDNIYYVDPYSRLVFKKKVKNESVTCGNLRTNKGDMSIQSPQRKDTIRLHEQERLAKQDDFQQESYIVRNIFFIHAVAVLWLCKRFSFMYSLGLCIVFHF